MADYTLNRTGAQIDAIGDRLTAQSTITELPNRTVTPLCSITLPANSTWIITAQERWLTTGTSGTFSFESEISDDTSMKYVSGHVQTLASSASNVCTSSSRLFYTSSGATIYLLGWQNSGTTLTANDAWQSRLDAIRIK